MKCNLPKSWECLPKREKEIIEHVKLEEAYKIADRQLAETQEIWIKLSCIFWRDKGMSEEDLLQYIAWWKRTYNKNARIKTKEEQKTWLDEEMTKCFPTVGFPQVRIDELKEKTYESY